jgi:hypothetical protein
MKMGWHGLLGQLSGDEITAIETFGPKNFLYSVASSLGMVG